MQGLSATATRLGNRLGRAENQPIRLGGVGLCMVGANIQAWQAEAPALSIQAYRHVRAGGQAGMPVATYAPL